MTLKPVSSRMALLHGDEIEPSEGTTTLQSGPSKTIDLESLSLSSYASLCTLISVCIGIAVSVLFFFCDVLGLNTTFQLGPFSFADNETGLVVLFVGPFVFGMTGFVGSLLSYRLFLWALKTFSGLQLTGTWKELGKLEQRKNTHHPM